MDERETEASQTQCLSSKSGRSRVVPDTDFAGYPANHLSGKPGRTRVVPDTDFTGYPANNLLSKPGKED